MHLQHYEQVPLQLPHYYYNNFVVEHIESLDFHRRLHTEEMVAVYYITKKDFTGSLRPLIEPRI